MLQKSRSLVKGFLLHYSRNIVLFLTIFYGIIVAIAIFNMAFLSNQLMEFQAKRTAQDYVHLIKEARTLYSADVVNRMSEKEIVSVTHNFELDSNSIPLPATFLLNLSQRIQKNKEVSFRLFSDYPFPWRADTGGPRDEFENSALAVLRQKQDQAFFRIEEMEAGTALRYAEADLMRPSCIACHNQHPDSPKTDWKSGDVRGVFEIVVPLASYRQLTQRQLGLTFFSMGSLGAVGLVGLSFALRRNRKYAQRLQVFNQGLEREVAARTEELSSTLEILEATQAELLDENARLKGKDHDFVYQYQVVGSLPIDSKTYVVRQADRILYQALKQGDYCFVLSSRQMGKSSLRVQQVKRLTADGITCATVDVTEIGSQQSTAAQWYAGLIFVLTRELGLLDQLDIRAWWKSHELLAPIQRLGLFFEEVVLTNIQGAVLIFLDEIDNVLSLDFPTGDLFILIRSLYEKRSRQVDFRRLSFVLLGVATPSQLIQDSQRTPFNIGKMIHLQGFAPHEAQPLLMGFLPKTHYPQVVLKSILSWTNGQPFLTQKICQLILEHPDEIPQYQEKAWVAGLVKERIIDDWERQDDPEHLRTIRDRLLEGDGYAVDRLRLLESLLLQGQVSDADSKPFQTLKLSGMVIAPNGLLSIKNRIYLEIFHAQWVASQLNLVESRETS